MAEHRSDTPRPHASSTGSDLPRLVTVTLSAVLCVLGSLWGSGVFGGPPVSEAAGGALSANATLLAPAGTAFSIWGLIYAGLVVYAVWQWLPGQRTSQRHRSAGWWIAGSMLLNALWLLVVREGLLWISVSVILVLAAVIASALRAGRPARGAGLADRLVTDGTLGIYLGWVTVATCANIAATLVDTGVEATGTTSEWIAVAVVVAAVGISVFLARETGGNVGIGLAVCWGLAWIGQERLSGAPESTTVGIVAVIAAIVALLVPVALRLKAGKDRLRVV